MKGKLIQQFLPPANSVLDSELLSQRLYFLWTPLPLKPETRPKLKHVSLCFHVCTCFLDVFLNTDYFLLYYIESKSREIYNHGAEGRCLAESQATFLDQRLQGVLSYATLGKYTQHQMLADDVSEGTDDVLITSRHKANRHCRHSAARQKLDRIYLFSGNSVILCAGVVCIGIICLCVLVCGCLCTCVCVENQRETLGVVPQGCHLPCYQRWGISLTCSTPSALGLLATELQSSSCLHCPSAMITSRCHCTFCVGSRDRTWALVILRQVLYN